MTETATAASHRSIIEAQQALASRLEVAGQLTDRQRQAVEKLQLQLQDEIRELVRLEANEAEIVRELDFAWEAQVDFESLELDRQHAEAEEGLKAANDRLARMAEENWDDLGDAIEADDEDREPTPAQEEGWDAREDFLRGSAL